MVETPNYIKALLKPNGKRPSGRRVWSIDLETVWLPFFTATNTMGDTSIPHEALGAPLRLAYDADGSVKFSKMGRPVIKVAREVQDSVKMVRENFIAGLLAYANGVAMENPEGYKAEVQASQEAGKPIVDHDREALQDALTRLVEAQAERPKAEGPKTKGKARPKAEKPKAQAPTEAPIEAQAPEPETEKVLVTA